MLNHVREVNTQEVSLMQQSVIIILQALKHWDKSGIRRLSGAPNKPVFSVIGDGKSSAATPKGNNLTFLEFTELRNFICSV